MLFDARNENIRVNGADFDYISFGTGRDVLVMLPGVGDGFKTAKGVALPFAAMYRCFARRYRVYVFSRRNDLPEGFTTADMADDVASILEALRIAPAAGAGGGFAFGSSRGPADVFGVSQGGMIAQQLAIRHPQLVRGLVLAVTASRPNDLMRDALGSWLAMADRGDYMGIMTDTAERSYTGSYLQRGRMMNKIIGHIKPKDYKRFRILCESCLSHDVYDELDKITCPTFIVGADRDRVLGAEASKEIHAAVPGSKLYMYEGYSHGVYEQAPDFNTRVLRNLVWQQIIRD